MKTNLICHISVNKTSTHWCLNIWPDQQENIVNTEQNLIHTGILAYDYIPHCSGLKFQGDGGAVRGSLGISKFSGF